MCFLCLNYEITCSCVSRSGDWVCTLCRTDQEPVETYECENMHPFAAVKAPYTLSNQDQRVSCREESVWFLFCW